MSSRRFKQLFVFDLSKNIYCFVRFNSILVTFFCLGYGIATADLSSLPPQQILEKPLNSKQTRIESLVLSARKAFAEKHFIFPVNNNTVYYVEQLLLLSPKDERGFSILSKVCNSYIIMAYKKLDNYETERAQLFHNNAEKITHQFNIDSNYQVLASLQKDIFAQWAMINEVKSTREKQTKTHRIKLKPQEKKLVVKEPQNKFIPPYAQQTNLDNNQFPENQKKSKKNTANKRSLNIVEREQFVVIVNKKNEISSLTLNELKSLYKEQKKTWPNGGAVTLYLPRPESDEFLWITHNIFHKKSPVSVIQFYMKGLNSNKFKIPVTSTNSVLDVSRRVGGIAVVKRGEAKGHDSIKIILIKGN